MTNPRVKTTNRPRRVGRLVRAQTVLVQQQPRRARRPRRAPTQNRALGAPVNNASQVKNVSSDDTVSGTDHIASVTIKAGTPKATLVFAERFNAGSGVSLKAACSRYTHYKVQKAKWILESKAATSCAGGYVAATSPDPSFGVTVGDDAINNILALRGAVSTKNWQGVVINASSTRQMRFTTIGIEDRLVSDHLFLMMLDSAPSEDVTFTLTLEWRVRLTGATHYDTTAVDLRPYLCVEDIAAKMGTILPMDQHAKDVTWAEGLAGFPKDDDVPVGARFVFRLPTAIRNQVAETIVHHRYLELKRSASGWDSRTSVQGNSATTWHPTNEDVVLESFAAIGDQWTLVETNVENFRVRGTLGSAAAPCSNSQRLTYAELNRSTMQPSTMLTISSA